MSITSTKSFFIDNHGCAKNQVDAEEMAAHLQLRGYRQIPASADADIIIVNTCGFIEDAKKESLEAVMAMRKAYPGKRILMAGCLSQRYAEALGSDLAEADGIFGNGDLSKIGDAVDAMMEGKHPNLVPSRLPYAPARRKKLMGFPRLAYVKIAEGCSNHCAFCAIPLIRGEISSREPGDVAAECAELIESGVYEICLIGQDLGSYGLDRGEAPMLPSLLEKISAIPGDFRVRMLYIHPDRFPLGILEHCARDPRILPYFDIPFQHASTPVLRAMNRSGDADRYLALIKTIRARLPGAVLRSTFLVGFPGETDEDFARLREFQDEARLDWLGAFAYSREEDTAAFAYKARVPKKIAAGRKQEIETAQRAITELALARFVGERQTVLVEERIENEELAIGRGSMNAPDVDGAIVVVGGDLQPGEVVEVVVSAVRGVDLEAVIIHKNPDAAPRNAVSGT